MITETQKARYFLYNGGTIKRKKIQEISARRRYIETENGMGIHAKER